MPVCAALVVSGAPLVGRLATARLACANAIAIAQRAGETDEEITRVFGYTAIHTVRVTPSPIFRGKVDQPIDPTER